MSDPPASLATDRRCSGTRTDRRRPAGLGPFGDRALAERARTPALRPDRRRPAGLALLLLVSAAAGQGPDDLPVRAAEAMRRATEAQQAGRFAGQEPGSVAHDAVLAHPDRGEPGFVWLSAYAVTNEPRYRDLALTRARHLAARQLQSGGWPAGYETAELDQLYTRERYRRGEPPGSAVNQTDVGDSAVPLRLLLEVAQATDDAELRAAADYGVRALVQAQRGDGSWPPSMPPEPTSEPNAGRLGVGTQHLVLRPLLVAKRLGNADAGQAAGAAAERLLRLYVTEPAAGWWTSYTADERPVADLKELNTTTIAEIVETLIEAADVLEAPHLLSPLPAVTASLESARLPGGGWAQSLGPGSFLQLGAPQNVAVPRALAAARAALRHGGRPEPEPTRAERARLTADRLPAVLDLLASQRADGTWLSDAPVPSLAGYVHAMRLLTDFLRDYEPLPDLPTDARPPQHRR